MKKFNKITSMIVLASAVSTMIPATVNAAVNLEANEGKIDKAQAFANGTYVFEGYRNEDEKSAVYFFNGKEDKEIEDVNGVGQKYGMNYINFNDDDVLFNLATGQVEDDIEDDIMSKAKTKLKSLVKKADRYKDTQNIQFVKKLSEDTFGTVWYEFLLKGDNTDKTYTIYIDNTGKYIDSSYYLNLVYYDKDGNKIDLDKYEDLSDNPNLSIVKEQTLLTDADSIYKVIAILDIAKVDEQGLQLLQEGDKNATRYILGKCPEAITTYALKISMEQGDKEDGAYVPKSVVSYDTYELDALNLIEQYDEGKVTARVSGNSLYVIKPDFEDEKITVDKYKLKKIKDEKSIEGKKLDKRVLELDEDFDDIQDEDMIDYSNDLYGNLWVLQKGKIKKMVEGKLETVYTVDRSINKLSVFAENSLIAWSTDSDIYSAVGVQAAAENKASETTEAVKEESKEVSKESEIQSGWIKNNDGSWSYRKDGVIAKGWIQDNGSWYYIDSLGIMNTGWFKDSNGKWYYLKESGEMACNTTIDGYNLGSDGAMY